MEPVAISQRLTLAAAALAAARASAALDDPVARFEVLYRAYEPFLRRIAERKFGISPDDAKTLVHDVFVTYLANPDVRDVHAYLIGAICNASRRRKERAAKERALFCDGPVCAAGPDDAMVEGVVRTLAMRKSLARLGPSCRETIERFCLNREPAASIAESRNTTANSIWRLVTFCRGRLKAIYATMQRAA